jgi:type IV pilus assembly protein PilA
VRSTLLGVIMFQALNPEARNVEKGFTLIELLVVIIIVGILGAIALPGFLSQASKARASEGVSNLGTLHRSLQNYRLRNPGFTENIALLDVRLAGRFYTYGASLIDANNVSTSATIHPASTVRELVQFDGAVRQNTVSDFFGQVICQSLAFGGNPGGAVAPLANGDRGSCLDPASAKLID